MFEHSVPNDDRRTTVLDFSPLNPLEAATLLEMAIQAQTAIECAIDGQVPAYLANPAAVREMLAEAQEHRAEVRATFLYKFFEVN
jgi:hypothetical protein